MTKKKTTSKTTKIKKEDIMQVEVPVQEDATTKVLRDQLEKLKQKVDENMELAMRAKAELENVRRRAEKDVASAHKFGTEKMVNELLPILDCLDQGLQTAKSGQSDANLLIQGTELTIEMFTKALSKFNVSIINPLNQPFDPSKHEAISMVKDGKSPANTIINVVQKGYVINERVIRPARVVVTVKS